MKAAARGFAWLVSGVVVTASCSPEQSLVVPSGCQPLEGELSCTLPYPSDFFRSGGVVALTGAGKPRTSSGTDADLVTPLKADGFSRQPTIACVLPDAVVSTGLPNVEDNAMRSMDPTETPSFLVRADTNELIPHYVDLDPAPDDPMHVVISIRPLVQLAPGTRYIAALTNVKNASHALAAPAEGFRRIRDFDTSRDPSLDPIQARFSTDVFAPLAKLGVARSALQIAWDFTTESKAWPEHDMLDLRALVQTWLDQNPTPVVTITAVTPGTAEYYREVTGTVAVPLYLDQPGSGGLLFRRPDGTITQNGMTDVPFKIVVPRSVVGQWGAARGLAFGHGFFGSTDELDAQPARTLVSTLGVVAFGIDWWGMSQADLGTVIGLLTTVPAKGHQFVERVYQAMVNWMIVTRAMRTSFSSESALHRPLVGDGVIVRADGTTNAGGILYDPTAVYYFGASLGHILGSIMSALDPDVERSVLEVGGAGYEQIMPRAMPFAGFNFFIKSAMGTELAAQTLESMMANALDRIDPATYAPYLIGSQLPGNPDRRVLLQAGIGDHEVPNCATYFHARVLGIPMMSPTPQITYGVPVAGATGLTSALAMWDFGISPNVYRFATPPAENPVHNGLRDVPSAIAQIDGFLRNGGTITDPCAPDAPWCIAQ